MSMWDLKAIFENILQWLSVLDNIPTKKKNAIATNVTSTASRNCHCKK